MYDLVLFLWGKEDTEARQGVAMQRRQYCVKHVKLASSASVALQNAKWSPLVSYHCGYSPRALAA